jgi:hypothetical protein
MGGEGGGDGGGGEGGEVAATAVATGTGGGEGARSTLSEVDQRPTLVSSTVLRATFHARFVTAKGELAFSWAVGLPILYPQSTEISVNLISN